MSGDHSPRSGAGATIDQTAQSAVSAAPGGTSASFSGGAQDPVTVTGWFLRQVRTRGDRPAMYARGREGWVATSWGELGASARSFAAFLISEGVGEAGHVAIWSTNRPEWHIADAAILLSRAVPVPVYTTFSPGQAGYVLQHSESRVAVAENAVVLERLLSVRDRIPGLRRAVVIEGLDKATPDGFALPWRDALERGASRLEVAASEIDRRVSAIHLDDTATLIYTSGTTGLPKAVQLTHRNLVAAESALMATFPSGPDERVLSYLPLAHVVERLISEFLSYRLGNPVWFLDGLDNLGPRLREVRPTIFFGVPRVWEKMARRVEDEVAAIGGVQGPIARWGLRVAQTAERRAGAGRLPSTLSWQRAVADRFVLGKIRKRTGLDRARHLVSGAAPIAEETLRFFHAIGLPVVEGYGQSENTAIATMNPPARARVGTVGCASEGVEIRIADDGEVLMRGPTVFPGYFKDETATREVIDPEGWLHTGDLGALDEHGYLRITGRKKDLIITAGGKNIAPSGIEEQLEAHRLVGHAVCVGDRRPYIAALLTLDLEEAAAWAATRHVSAGPEALAGNDELRTEIANWVGTVNANLSRPEQVKRWVLLDHDFEVGRELTPTLKVKRPAVAELYAEEIEALYG
jgi:long-chain acyl-CoA synthetase